MSDYGRESGEVKLPVKEWKSFRDNLYKRYNHKLEELYSIALAVHKEISEKKKGKRGVNLHALFRDVIKTKSLVSKSHYYSGYLFEGMIKESLIKDKKLVKPKKKDFVAVKASKGETLYDDMLQVEVDNKTKTIYYSTDDNNHAVDCGRESFLGSLVFRGLERVEFSSKTGGYFRATSEYNEDEFGNGGQSRVSCSFGKYKNNKKLARQLYGF